MTLAGDDAAIFDKIAEAGTLYERYVQVAAVAERAVMRDLVAAATADQDEPPVFHPVPLTIAFRAG